MDMILPCRIRGYRNQVCSLHWALLLVIILQGSIAEIVAQKKVSAEDSPIGWLAPIPLEITTGVDFGYDDHVLGNSNTSSSGQDSLFARENVVLSYIRGGQRTQVHLIGVGRFTQFFDAGADDKDGNITLSLAHNFTKRVSVYVSGFAAYQTEPDFGSDVGVENVRSDHFFTKDIFSLSYRWVPRLALVSSYTFKLVKYSDSSIGEFQDRSEHTFGEQLQFSLTSRTSLSGIYRFQIIDYDTAPNDSVTHYALAGIDHHITEHVTLNLLGGESFRSFQAGGDATNPYVAGTFRYVRSNHSLTWITSYGFESPNVQNASSRTTIRTGLKLDYDLTSRLGATVGVYYHHDDNENVSSSTTTSTGTQDAFDLSAGLRYTINKHFGLHLGYRYTTESSLGSNSGYARNRIFAGFTYNY
jgi:opacity protein-like surface antigen